MLIVRHFQGPFTNGGAMLVLVVVFVDVGKKVGRAGTGCCSWHTHDDVVYLLLSGNGRIYFGFGFCFSVDEMR